MGVSYPLYTQFQHSDIQCQQGAPSIIAVQIIKKYSLGVSWLLLLKSNRAGSCKLFFISQEEVFTETKREDYRFMNKQL